MRNTFSLFQSHLDLAHSYWANAVQKGDIVIDATCGNGYDTLKLCQLALFPAFGKVYAIDIQPQAIHATHKYLEHHLSSDLMQQVEIQQRCHSIFPSCIESDSVKMIVYNLGYLPGGNKNKTTMRDTTLLSLQNAQTILKPEGLICVTCYPGHPEGAMEQEMILTYISQLSPREWSCCHHTWLNRKQAPSLLIIQKAIQ